MSNELTVSGLVTIHMIASHKITFVLSVLALGLVVFLNPARALNSQWIKEWPNTDFAIHSVDLDEIISGGVSKDAIRSIDYALRMGAKVLNNSWGGGAYSMALRDAIIASYYEDRVFVVAAGNNAVNIDKYPSFPPSYAVPNMITVAALNDSSSLAWFSNWGPLGVHIGAPGVSIRSAVPKEMCSSPPCYSYLSGTSMGDTLAIWASIAEIGV